MAVLLGRERRAESKSRFARSLGVIGLCLIMAGALLLAAVPHIAVLVLLLASAVTVWFLFASRAARRMWVYAAALGPLAVMASPVLLGIWFFGCHPWKDTAQLRVSDGRMLHVQRFWESDILTEELDHHPLFLQTRVIAGAYGEYFNVALVRPAASDYDFPSPAERYDPWKSKSAGRLVQSTDGRFVAFIYQYKGYPSNRIGCATNLVYDLATGERWDAIRDMERLLSLSPFVLVGRSDPINTADVEAMMVTGGQYVGRCQDPATIGSLRAHPNPWVRVAVSRWQQTLSQDVRTLRRELAQEAEAHSDRGQRIAAREALAWLDELIGR
jgi:hypothetical protein